MMDILMSRSLGGLRPIDEAGEQMLSKISQGRLVRVVVTQPRNIRHHRMFFALLNAVYKNLPETVDIPSLEALLGAMKLAVGHYDVYTSSNGHEFRIPKSISFASMDQTEFDAFFSKCCDVINKHFIHGVTEAVWRAEIAEMTGAVVDPMTAEANAGDERVAAEYERG